MSELVALEEIQQAATRLAGVTLHTPLLPFPAVAPTLLIKPESLQPTGSFKLRGAYNAISALSAPQRARGVIAHSSGNHAIAVAYAAASLGVPATVVVPRNASAVKLATARRLGATVVTCEPSLAARQATTNELRAKLGLVFIPPFDAAEIIAGQGTIGLEIAADCPDADLVICPVSGGGLISGVAAALAAVNPRVRVVGVEPELAADAQESLRTGHAVTWPPDRTGRTVADALRVSPVGELPMLHLREYVHDIVTVSEGEILAAIARTALEARLVAEPGGVVAVAACLFRSAELPASSVRVAVLSGGNIDPAVLSRALADG